MKELFLYYRRLFFAFIVLLYVALLSFVMNSGYDASLRYLRLVVETNASRVFSLLEDVLPKDYHDKVLRDELYIRDEFEDVAKNLSGIVHKMKLVSISAYVVGANGKIYLTVSDYIDRKKDQYFSELDKSDAFYAKIRELVDGDSSIADAGGIIEKDGEHFYDGCRRMSSTGKNEYFVCLAMSVENDYLMFKKSVRNGIFEYVLLVAGFILIIVSVSRNISFRENMLQEEYNSKAKDLSEALAKARKANHIKSEFIAGLSHSIRTPLNAVIGFSEAMQSNIFGPLENEKYVEYINYIHESSKLILDFLDDILDITKLEIRHFDVQDDYINVHDILLVVKRLMRGVKGADERNIDVYVPPLDFPDLKIDKKMLLQILLSLMSNGIKYTKKGGYVMLKVFINEKNGRMAFSVKDDGAGISDDACERINSALNQDESQDLMYKHFIGTGIGLSLVRNYVKMFDGDIYFVSAVNCGSEFIVSFPKERVRVK